MGDLSQTLEIIEKQPTYRELIECITAASKLPPGYVKEDMLKELTVLLHRINNPPTPVVLSSTPDREG